MRSLAVTQENLDNQREAVKEEKRLRYDNQPYVNGFLRLFEMSFKNAANAHSTIGSMAGNERGAKLTPVCDQPSIAFQQIGAPLIEFLCVSSILPYRSVASSAAGPTARAVAAGPFLHRRRPLISGGPE